MLRTVAALAAALVRPRQNSAMEGGRTACTAPSHVGARLRAETVSKHTLKRRERSVQDMLGHRFLPPSIGLRGEVLSVIVCTAPLDAPARFLRGGERALAGKSFDRSHSATDPERREIQTYWGRATDE